MKETTKANPIGVDALLDRAIADGRRRRSAAALQAAAGHRLAHCRHLYSTVVSSSCLVVTAVLFSACTPVADGRDMRSPDSHRVVLEHADNLIRAL